MAGSQFDAGNYAFFSEKADPLCAGLEEALGDDDEDDLELPSDQEELDPSEQESWSVAALLQQPRQPGKEGDGITHGPVANSSVQHARDHFVGAGASC